MGYHNENQVMIKSEILSLKDMNPAIQGMLLKLRDDQYLSPSNYSVSQQKWKTRSSELNETTLQLIINQILKFYNANSTEHSYGKSYALHLINENMKFTDNLLDQISATPLLKDLMEHSYITIKSVSPERQRKMIDQLLDDARKACINSDYNPDIPSIDALVRGLSIELYDYLKESAAKVARKIQNLEQAEKFKEHILKDSIGRDIPLHEDCALDIAEMYGPALLGDLLRRLRTEEALSIDGLPDTPLTSLERYGNDYQTMEEQAAAYLGKILTYNNCPKEYLKKIMAHPTLTEDEELQNTILDLEREDARPCQLQLMLRQPQVFTKLYRNSYSCRGIFMNRLFQLLLGRPDFYTTVKDVMTDESTFDLPKPAQDLIS